jgi:hypothetical protein
MKQELPNLPNLPINEQLLIKMMQLRQQMEAKVRGEK